MAVEVIVPRLRGLCSISMFRLSLNVKKTTQAVRLCVVLDYPVITSLDLSIRVEGLRESSHNAQAVMSQQMRQRQQAV